MRKIHPLYLALDFENGDKALQFLEGNQLEGVPVKVGMELFYKEGNGILTELRNRSHGVFLDLKLHDIPTTVKKAMRNLARLDVDIINVHAQGGKEMIIAAREGLEEGAKGSKRPALLAVTHLTSTDQKTFTEELLQTGSVADAVIHLAQLAKNAGADGVVCSVHEAAKIKEVCGSDFMTVTPGIRSEGMAANDQKRTATPREAKEQGVDAMVIGRGITSATTPLRSYEQIIKEWNHAE